METRSRHSGDVSVVSSKDDVRKQGYRERGLKPGAGLGQVLSFTVRLLAAVSLFALLLPVAMPNDVSFAAATQTLTVTSANPDSGVSITVSPIDSTGIGSGSTPFTRHYSSTVAVTLTAPSTAEGNNFVKWQRNGVDYATTVQTVVPMNTDCTLKAVYAAPAVNQTLTVTSDNPGSGVSITVSPLDNTGLGSGTTPFSRTYLSNTVVTLTAPSTAGGNNFQKWQIDGVDFDTAGQIHVPMDANYTLKAVYAAPAIPRTLNVTSSNPDSGVSITVSPPDNDRKGTGTTPFTRTYADRAVVTLTAPRTAGGNNFVMWRRNGSDYSHEYQISAVMDAGYSFEAHYEPLKPTRTLNVISANPDIAASVTVSPSDKNGQADGTTPFARSYSDGSVVTLIPIWVVQGDIYFLYWEIDGAPFVDSIVATVTMNRDHTLIAHYEPPTIGMNFSVYGQNSVSIGKGSSISGGNVGAGTALGGSPFEGEAHTVRITGARIDGDVYGDTVYLGQGTRVQNVYANHLTNEKGRYQRLASLPDRLPRVLPLTGGRSGTEALMVPAKGRALLGQRQTEVRIEDGATAVLSGGRYEFESLELGNGSRLIIQAPSFLIVNRSLETGEKSVVGPADSKVPLNLTIIVRGADKNRSAAILGPSSKIQAAIRVPSGTLEIRNKVKANGSYYASAVEIGEGVKIVSPAWDDTPDRDPQCIRRVCRSVGHQIVCQNQVTEGASCDDGNACTVGDACTAKGYCQSGPPITDPNPAGNPCLRNICDPIAGIYQPLGTVCDPSVQCRQPSMCDGQGECNLLGALLPEGTLCDDGIPNNGTDTCYATGWCAGSLGPYDCLANNCSANPGEPPDLECWIGEHPSIRNGIRWVIPLPGDQGYTFITWDQWEPWRRQALQQAFEDAWNWYDGGMTNFQGTSIPEPPPNKATLSDDDSPETIFDENTAWPLYLAHLAHSLLVEIKHVVPWSLCDYPFQPDINTMLPAYSMYWVPNNVYPDFAVWGAVTPAHPTNTFFFMTQNGLIGQTRSDTIARVLEWARRLQHFIGPFTAKNTEGHWHYRGLPPVSRVIEGTVLDPAVSPGFPNSEHWTMGCGGTTGFLKEVLKAVNIPVMYETVPNPACGHSQPYFPSEGNYLSHGDDPYVSFFKNSTVLPQPGEILIDQATYLNWFTGTDEYVCGNIGRKPMELVLKLLPDLLVTYYCWDVAANTPHESGHVYDALNYYYSLQELEAGDLWGRLSQRASELGLCTGN